MHPLSVHQTYLNLADNLINKHVSQNGLLQTVLQLPPLDETILQKLVAHTEKVGLSEPSRRVAILKAVSRIAHCQMCDLHMQSKVGLYLGAAYNHWAQPQKAATTILQARRGFMKLNDSGWIAVCDWQLNSLPWTSPDIHQTVHILKQALNGLQQAGFKKFANLCRLTLAYAQILTLEFDDANENIDACELIFIAQGDHINQAHCWLDKASLLRRQNQYTEAFAYLEKALTVFKKEKLPISIAKTYYQVAFCYFRSTTNYKKAEKYFQKAAASFIRYDLKLYYANCLNGLGQVNIILGYLSKASEYLEQERILLLKCGIPSLSANNYNDTGQLELLKGEPEKSIVHFKNAERLYHQAKMRLPEAIALANQGDAYAFIGRYQDALYCLELAQKQFQKFDNRSRLAGCDLYLSKVWMDLNQYKIAHKHLDEAEKLFSQIEEYALMAWIHNQRAKIFSVEGKQNEAVASLKNALATAERYGTRPQVALAQRQLGEVLSVAGWPVDALQHISSAEINFDKMGMIIEQAATLNALGYHYLREQASQHAENAFERALEISRNIMPDIENRAYMGLAALAEEQNKQEIALVNYHKATTAAMKLRDSFWQPELAGSYLEKSIYSSHKAVSLAVKLKADQDALVFIESSKAQSLVKQIISSVFFHNSNTSTELDSLRIEIQSLQRQLRTNFNSRPMPQFSKIREIQQKLIACAKIYDEKLGQIERQNVARSALPVNSQFNIEKFRDFAGDLFGKSWVALDYYLKDNKLFGIMVSHQGCKAWEASISSSEQSAIERCAITNRGAHYPTNTDLELLGNLLLPAQLQKHLHPNSYLIIAPHQILHTVPWAALQSEHFSGCLVENSIPLITPSLEILQLTQQSSSRPQKPDQKTGLLLGVANFKESRRALPLVHGEIESIFKNANPDSISLVDLQVTWNALKIFIPRTLATTKG